MDSLPYIAVAPEVIRKKQINKFESFPWYYANDVGKTNICVNEVGTVIFRLKKLSFLGILETVMHTTIHNLLVEGWRMKY